MPRPDTGTRQKLLDTAKTLIWTSSYGAVSVDDICRTAGVKKGSFYHYFPSKQDLALAVMEEYYQYKIEAVIKPVFAANKTLGEQINDLADVILRDNRENLAEHGCVCGCPLAALGSEMIGQEDRAIREKVEEIFSRCRDLLTTAILRACESGEIPMVDEKAKAQEIHELYNGLDDNGPHS